MKIKKLFLIFFHITNSHGTNSWVVFLFLNLNNSVLKKMLI